MLLSGNNYLNKPLILYQAKSIHSTAKNRLLNFIYALLKISFKRIASNFQDSFTNTVSKIKFIQINLLTVKLYYQKITQ
jgi:hypothetical protein